MAPPSYDETLSQGTPSKGCCYNRRSNVTLIIRNMKHFCVFFLLAAISMAADFTTGQAGRAVVGQSTFTGTLTGASQTLIGGASGLAFKNDTLFVADSNRLGSAP